MRWRQRVPFSGAIVIYSKIFSLGTACIPSSRSSVPSVLPVLDQARQQAFHDRFMPAQAVFVIVRHASPPSSQVAEAAAMALGGAGAACPCGDDGEHVDGVGQERDAETDSVHDDDQICGRDCGQGRFPPAARPTVFRRPNRVHPRPTLQVPLDSTLS